jgi:hypothetical protein
MQITLSPIRMDATLTVTRAGDVLTINGTRIDLSAPTPNEWIIDSALIDGLRHVTLIFPHGATPPPETLSPAVIDVSKDGPVPLPPHDGDAPETPPDPITERMDPVAAKASLRTSAVLPRADFCRALKDHGILTPVEAVQAAKGNWPDTFDAAIAALPIDPFDAQIDWATANEAGRTSPLFLAVLEWYGAAQGIHQPDLDRLADAIFNLTD